MSLRILFPFFGEFFHEMLIWIGIDAFDLVAWLFITSVTMGLWGWLEVGMGGADGAGRVATAGFGLLKHFFQISMLIRKMARAIPIMAIMAAGEVKVQWVLAGRIWSSSLNNSPLYFVMRPWMAVWMPSVLAQPKSSANSPGQSMVFFWISIISDSSAEITVHGLDEASRFHCDCVSWVDLACLDRVLGLAYLVREDGSCGVNRPDVFH